ncbi:MAG: hypothetical protein LUB61_00585 [Eggerthellaceae bacterium]|nr:hypothetical protein [Eggerthellaceae bacterium]
MPNDVDENFVDLNDDDYFGEIDYDALDIENSYTEFLAPEPERIPEIESAVKVDEQYYERPVKERIEELFSQMKPYRRFLLNIIDLCREIKSQDDVDALVAEMHKDYKSIYTAANLCAMLYRAGAISKVTEDGSEYKAEEVQPVEVEEEGHTYLEPGQPLPVYWISTQDGIDYAAADNPRQRLVALFEKEERYLPIYKRVLSMTSVEGGTQAHDLSQAVDNDPLIQNPRFFVQHFLENLEHRDAVRWHNHSWTITSLGQEFLDGQLAEVVDPGLGDAEMTLESKKILAEEMHLGLDDI